MTRDQHATEKALVAAETAWLLARSWKKVVGGFDHPRVQGKGLAARPFNLRDAVAATRANPMIAWP